MDYYTYYLHALVLLRLEPHGDHTAARRSLDEALRRSPQFAPAYLQRAKLWNETGQAARALADLQTATQLDNTYAEPFYLMAQIDYRLGKRNEAEQARVQPARKGARGEAAEAAGREPAPPGAPMSGRLGLRAHQSLPSSTMMLRFEGTLRSRSTRPLGQRRVISSTVAWLPRPKCSLRSFCER